MFFPTSDVVKIAQIIARNEGFDVGNEDLYYFDIKPMERITPMVRGYVTIGFFVNDHGTNFISISETTGQTIDIIGCEVFDYPELQKYQRRVMDILKTKKKTPQELADDVECTGPVVLTRAVPIVKVPQRRP